MKEELISFKTAKLAKEKGFDWEVYNVFKDVEIYGELDYGNPIDLIADNDGFMQSMFSNGKDTEGMYAAPTQSLLQRWLREVHNIFLTVEYSLSNDNWFYYLYKQEFNKYIHFKIYEKALEAGLLEALKLIK